MRDRAEAHVGSLEEVFYDARDHDPEWFAIGVGPLGRKLVLAPASAASVTGFEVKLAFSADIVKGAPELRHDELDPDTRQAARAYYARAPLDAC